MNVKNYIFIIFHSFHKSVYVGTCALLVFFFAIVFMFYYAKFHKDNSLPTIDLREYRSVAQLEHAFDYGIEQCVVTNSKVAVSGWLVRRGEGSIRRHVAVVIAARMERYGRALSTSLEDSADKNISQRLNDGTGYRYASFNASVDRKALHASGEGMRLFIAYEDAMGRVLLPLSCRI